MSNIIDSIQLSGTVYTLSAQTSGGGNPTVELTQAQYDALVTAGTVQADTYYIITDAQAGDLTNYYTKTETNTLLNGKQATLVSGTNIKTINNESLLGSGNITIQGGGGGGKAVSGGTNISITTGETADTINCTLPITAGTHSTNKGIIVGDNECSASGEYSISIGHNSDADGNYSFCNGSNSNANGQMSFAYGRSCETLHDYGFAFGSNNKTTRPNQFLVGYYTKPKNQLEVNFGTYNNSVSASTTFGDGGNTLFAIGNGYDFSSTHNWHNAFEVRQNGDIYIANTNDTSVTGDTAYSLYPMIKLQDHLGGGGGGKAVSGGTNISITTGDTADTINCTLPIVELGSYNIVFTDKGYGSGNHTLSFGDGASTPSFYSMSLGNFTNARGNYSVAIGYGGRTNSDFSNAFGYYTITNNQRETAQGAYNNSVSGSSTFGDSGNTLFSVGNGTAKNARHNAFEIRQNGDIYITSGETDILLQDHLGGGNVPESRLNLLHGYGTSGGTDLFSWSTGSTSQVINEYVAFSKINNTSIICDEQTSPTNFSLVETSAITTSISSSSTDAQVPSAKAVNDKLGGLSVVKLTESEYTALVTKDSNTLYVVVPDPSN